MNNRKELLQVKGLETTFFTDDGAIPAVDHISFSLNEGEILGIVGESGCGKSVTSLSIMGLVPSPPGKITSGEILLDGKDLTKLSPKEMRKIRGKEIAMIFQEPMTSLNPLFTIGNQLTEAILIHHKSWSKKKASARAVEMMKLVGLPRAEELLKEYPYQLSGGMRQRVMIAMALVCDPKVLIADEPTTALDVTIQAQILQLMKDLNVRLNTAVMLITHDLGVVAETCERVVVDKLWKRDLLRLFSKILNTRIQKDLFILFLICDIKNDVSFQFQEMYRSLELLNRVAVLLHAVNLHLIVVRKRILIYIKQPNSIKQDAS